MNILLLGGSNSIIATGYRVGLEEVLPGARIVNLSIGHSVAIQYAYRGGDDFSRFDAVILENLVNDELYCKHYGGVDYFASLYFELFSTIAAQTRLYVLGMGSQAHFENPTEIYYMHKDVAEASGATFVSVREFVLEHGRRIVGEGAPLMRDEAHPVAPVAIAFGRALAGRMLDDMKTQREAARRAQSFAHNFGRVVFADAFAGRSVTRATTQISERFAVMGAGDSVRFARDITPVGVYLDYADTHAFARFAGDGEALVKRFYFMRGGEKPMVRFVPLRCDFPVSGMEIAPPADAFESSFNEVLVADEAAPVASIIGVATWSGAIDDRGIARRGLRQRLCEPARVDSDALLVLSADALPALSGWHAAAPVEGGRSVRWTGTQAESALLFDFPAGAWEFRVVVAGAVSGDAVQGLRVCIDGAPCASVQATSSRGVEITATLHAPGAGERRVSLRPGELKNGYGVLVEEIALRAVEARA